MDYIKKIIIVILLVLIVLINPSKSKLFNFFQDKNTLAEVKSIEIDKKSRYIGYDDNLVLFDDNKISLINENGKYLFSLDKKAQECNIESNEYIDILTNNSNLSLNKKGEVAFSQNASQKTIIYKSINEYLFLTAYKEKDKEYIKIQEKDRSLVKLIECNNKITNISILEDKIIVVGIKSEDKLNSEVTIYDTNGNLNKTMNFDDLILELIVSDKYIYLVFEDKITILDSKLNEKQQVKLNKLSNLDKTKFGKIYIHQEDGQVSSLEGEKYEKLKKNPNSSTVRALGKTYITYSKDKIYNEKNKEIYSFDEEIKDIVPLTDKTIAVGFEKSIKLITVK